MASNPSLKRSQRVVRVGKFEVVAHVATGGMGAVYRAIDTENGLEYALKVLTPEMAARGAMLERFRREARSAAKLQHENIVRVYDFDEYRGTYYIVMEFVDGIDLADHIENSGSLDPEETRQIMIQACRALKQAHAQAIVHRDIKPSNFLLTKKNGRLLVKLTDFGLAREVTNEECRVTRAGTTVGTVDYLSPEQARESSSADIRSDIYSLGCTWFHMLAGQPPFEGGLAERILKHLQEPPPDVRQFNPRVSKALVPILNKMLEKSPRNRYQTPAELLDDLVTLFPVAKSSKETSRLPVAAGQRDDTEAFTPSSKRSASKRKSKSTRRDGETVTDWMDTVETMSPRRLWIGGTVAAGILLVGAVILAITLKWLLRGGPSDVPSTPSESNGQQSFTTFLRPDRLFKLPSTAKPEPTAGPSSLPTLLPQQAPPLEVAKLRERLDKAFPNPPTALHEPPVRVQRTAGGETMASATLVEALARTPADRPATIEIEDNGPHFWSTTTFAGRDVTVCAAKGYRPLIVWDMDKTIQERGKAAGKPHTFLTIERGRLTLQGVDIVVQAPDSFKEPLTLVQATDADFSARDCTFSVSGRPVNPLVVMRFVATKPEKRCRFSNCVLRGNSLQALDLDAPGGLVLFENCLAAGGEFPLLQVQGGEPAASVFAVRSTLVSGAKLLGFQGGNNNPSLNWFAWDSILSRSNDKLGGEMIILPVAGTAEKIKWESVNTLYAGWQTLLTGVERVPSENGSAWQRLMQVSPQASERAIPDRWPAAQTDLSEAPASVFRTARTPVVFAASVNNQETIGCVLEQLPPLRDNWKSLAAAPHDGP
jgi:serine/threonine protein kinase